MPDTLNSEPIPRRLVAYYRQRLKNRVFSELAKYFASQVEKGVVTRKILADRLSKDPAQITRLFAGPSNLTLETISDVLLALDAEIDVHVVSLNEPVRRTATLGEQSVTTFSILRIEMPPYDTRSGFRYNEPQSEARTSRDPEDPISDFSNERAAWT